LTTIKKFRKSINRLWPSHIKYDGLARQEFPSVARCYRCNKFLSIRKLVNEWGHRYTKTKDPKLLMKCYHCEK